MFGVIVIMVFIVYWMYVHIHDGAISIQKDNQCKENREPYYFDEIANSRFYRLAGTGITGDCQWECGETVFYSNNGGKYYNPYQDRRYQEYLKLKANPTIQQNYFMVDRWGKDSPHTQYSTNEYAEPGVKLLPLKDNLPPAFIVDFCDTAARFDTQYHQKRYYMDAQTHELLFPIEGESVTAEEDKEIREHWNNKVFENKYSWSTWVICDWTKIEQLYKERGLNYFNGHDTENFKAVAI